MQQQNNMTLTSWGNVNLWNLKDTLRTLEKEFHVHTFDVHTCVLKK